MAENHAILFPGEACEELINGRKLFAQHSVTTVD